MERLPLVVFTPVLIRTLLCCLGWPCLLSQAHAQCAGQPDPAFFQNAGINGEVTGAVVQSDDKIVVVGSFTSPRAYICRLNTDGSLDTTYSTKGQPSGIVLGITQQNDGKMVMVGAFSYVGGNYSPALARLNVNGTFDNSLLSPGFDMYPSTVTTQMVGSELRLLVGGAFTTVGGASHQSIARLTTSGNVDNSFSAGSVNGAVYGIATDPDNRVLVGGAFTYIGGTYRQRIARLQANGTADGTFGTGMGGANGTVYTVAMATVAGDYRVVFGGDFTSVYGQARGRLARVTFDGSLDSFLSSQPGANSTVKTLLHQPPPASKLFIGGHFTAYNNVPVGRLVVASTQNDGAIDTCFNTCGVIGGTPGPYVQALAQKNLSSPVIAAGEFTQHCGQNRTRVTRLLMSPCCN